ncbi:MAG: ATP-binding cassette domain-containing protein [Streptosporangiaceae bacterium]
MTTPSADDARPADDAGRASAPGQTPPTGEAPEPNVPQSTADIEGTPGHPGPALDAEAAAEQARLTAAHADAAAAAHAAGRDEVAAEEAELAVTAADAAAADARLGATRAETTFAEAGEAPAPAPATASTATASSVAAANGAEPLLRLVGLGKHFGPVRALTGVDLDIPDGQVTAVVGDNGAGKSTLIKTISGIWEPDEGEVIWKGRPVRLHSPKDAAELGIATVYQDLALADNLDIVQNMFLGRELVKYRVLDESAMEKAAKSTLADLSVVTVRSVRQPVGSLSGGQRQAVAVARAVLREAQLVVLDEPTAALGVTQTRVVLDLIRRLKTQGIAVIVISHNLNDVFSVADRVAVLRLGRVVSVGPKERYDSESVVDLMTTGTSKRLAAVPAESPSGSSSEH